MSKKLTSRILIILISSTLLAIWIQYGLAQSPANTGQIDSMGTLDPGDIDPSFGRFGTDGIIESQNAISHSALQSDGKIIVVDQEGMNSERTSINIRRYHPDGQLDDTFLAGVNVSYGGVSDIIVQPDDKIVVVGWANKISQEDFMIFRVGADGGLDSDFIQPNFTDFNQLQDYATSVALQLDATGQSVEKIVVAGYTRVNNVNSNNWDYAVVRYHPDGRLDTAFGDGGKVHTGFGGCFDGDDKGYDVVVQPDGKIIVAGQMDDSDTVLGLCFGYDYDFGLVRYNVDGSLDASFGGGGRVNSGFGGDSDEASNIALLADGKIVAAGRSDHTNVAIVRYHSDGQEDESFHANGKFTINLSPGFEWTEELIIQPDGKMVILANVYDLNDPQQRKFVLLRFQQNGNFDPTFAENGIRAYVVRDGLAEDMSLQQDNKFLVAGYIPASEDIRSGFLMRIRPNGSPDQNPGKVVTSFGPWDDRAYAITTQANGSIIVAGEADTFGSHKQLALAQYDANGMPDGSFGQSGQVLTGLTGTDDAARAVAVTFSGKIVVGGFVGDSDADMAVWRFNADGSPDSSFNGGHSFDFVDYGQGNDYGQAVLIQKDAGVEKIIVVGFANNGLNSNNVALARWLPDGSLDNSFGDQGLVNTYIGPGFTRVRAAALQPDGKIVVAGRFAGDFMAVRYHKNGQLDTDFGHNGVARVAHPSSDEAWAVAVLPNGTIALAGYVGPAPELLYPNGDFGLAFLNADGTVCVPCSSSQDFDFGGMAVRTNFGGDEAARAITVQPDGKILVAGGKTDSDSPGSEFYVARYQYKAFPVEDRGYMLDTSFQGNGKLSTAIAERAEARAIILDSDYRILVAGFSHHGNDDDFSLVRYLNDAVAPPPPPDDKVFLPVVLRP